jgi:signal transduction histidine kinase
MMKSLSMKSKMALAVSALFVVAFAVMALFTISYFERESRKNIFSQQFALSTSFADDLDDKLRIAQRALLAGSARISPDFAENADKAQGFLDNRPTLLSIFDNGIFLISRDGKLIAESPYLPNRRGRDISFRAFYQKTAASGKPHISDPYISTHNPGKPAVMLTVPLFDSHGALMAILGGSINLLGENMLQEAADLRIGKTGYFYVFCEDRTIIVHPDRERIMKPAAPPGANKLFDRAVSGFEGSGETVNSRGVRLLASFKHLQTTEWIVAANYPAAEAYAPLRRAERYFILATMAGTAVVLFIVWLLMKRLTLPLAAITRHVEALPEKSAAGKRIEIDTDDEIGTLARAFNTMIGTLDLQQGALQQAVEQARDEKAKSEAIIAAIGDGISIQGLDFKVLYQNHAHQVLAKGSCLGDYCYERYSHRDDVCPECPLALSFMDGRVHKLEKVYPLEDEKLTHIEITASPLRDGHGKIVAGIELVRDVSQQKQAEAAVRNLNTQLEERVKERTAELESFCYTVSHDLRAPLRGISGFCAMLREDYEERLYDAGRGYLGRISAAAVRMGGLIDDLLDLARVTRSELRFEMIDLSRLARTIALELQQLDPERRVEFVISAGVMAKVDRQLFQVALENLLGNAWKFTGRVTEEARIEFGVCRCGGEKRYYVRDNGVGFDMSHAHKLFKPFQRLHAMNEFSGTGIGLASVQRIVQRHGGRIWVEAEAGKGASFYFTLGA